MAGHLFMYLVHICITYSTELCFTYSFVGALYIYALDINSLFLFEFPPGLLVAFQQCKGGESIF